MSFDSIQDNWDIFKQIVSDATIQYVPTSVSRPNKSPPRWSRSVSRSVNESMLPFQDIEGLRLIQTTLIIRPKGMKSNLRSRLLKYHMNNLSLTSFVPTRTHSIHISSLSKK